MILIILGHLLGDFYLQTDKIATKKKTMPGYMLLHCFLYSIAMYIVMIILTENIREIILLLGLMGQYGAVGFVLTAKSLARYKQLEKKAFAEKYLVGTLLSAFIAFGCVAMCCVII